MDSSHHRNNGSSSAVQNQAISSEESPCLVINGTTLDWSGRGTSHVDYNRNEELPLNQGRFLGYGVHGGVYETRCKGIPLAWKRKFCRTKIGKRELQEIEIIKRLNHRHIIKLVGTYTHRQFLGLLLWPVAVCDLADLMEDVDWLLQVYVQDVEQEIVEKGINWIQSSSDFHAYEDDDGRSARLKALGLWVDSYMTTSDAAIRYLENSTSCIASAVAYLHDQGVKHKDLKPSNVLLSANGLWLTDFGTATDFSLLTQSATEGGDRGTPKYFAPEVAAYAPSGRSADIFSLGCIFFEIITLAVGFTLEEMKALRPENDRSFQANLANIISWFRRGGNHTRKAADEYFMGLVRRMISPGATDRPTAREIVDEISMINGFGFLEKDIRGFYCGGCCTSDYSTLEVLPQGPCTDFEMQIVIGNTYHYRPEPPKVHAYTCFVTPSLPELVEKVHIFKVIIDLNLKDVRLQDC